MKNKTLFLILTMLLMVGNTVFAHGDEDHREKQQDTTTIEADAQEMDSSISHGLQERNHHLKIEESEIVEAEMSDFSNLHPLVVHFPIVLLLLAVITQIASFFLWKKQLSWITFLLLAGGFLGAYVASTFVHPHTTGLTQAASLVLEKHDLFASYTMWLSGIGLLLKAVSLFFLKDKLWLEIAIVIMLAGAAFTVSKAGHYGATLAHIHGVGVQGKFIESHNDNHDHNH